MAQNSHEFTKREVPIFARILIKRLRIPDKISAWYSVIELSLHVSLTLPWSVLRRALFSTRGMFARFVSFGLV